MRDEGECVDDTERGRMIDSDYTPVEEPNKAHESVRVDRVLDESLLTRARVNHQQQLLYLL